MVRDACSVNSSAQVPARSIRCACVADSATLPVVQDVDPVGGAHRGETGRDQQHRTAVERLVDLAEQLALGLGVDSGASVVLNGADKRLVGRPSTCGNCPYLH
jgi:hypothetical protein